METFESFQDAYLNLQNAVSIEREIIILKTMKIALKQSPRETDLEEEFLTIAVQNLGEDLADPFPRHRVEDILFSQDEINYFIFYVLERRFGWSEGSINDGNEQAGDAEAFLEKETKLKSQLNALLDEFLKWFLSQKMSKALLCSFGYAISKASNRPVVRHQTVIHYMDWLQCNAHKPCFQNNWYQAQELIFCSLTDIWSAIRNACVTRLGVVVENFTLAKLEAFYISLCKICQDERNPWQSVEGAIMAVNTILRRFHWLGRLPSSSLSKNGAHETKYYLRFGHEELSQLPRFLSESIHSLIYPLLAHPQLSIREQATKVFSSFLLKCEFQEALGSFKEAVSRLAQGTNFSEMISKTDLPPEAIRNLPHAAVVNKDYQFLNAYEAEGLIGVCVSLIKHIPLQHLLGQWSLYFSVFNIYLMHPASTVRQVTSTLLKYIVAKSTNSAVLLKLILQSLVAHWYVDISDLSKLSPDLCKKVILHQGKVRKYTPATNNNNVEGPEESAPMPSISGCRESDRDLKDLCAEDCLSETWEWREGRLLSYELIAKFLVLNHVYYIAPPYEVYTAKLRATASTDGAMQMRQAKVFTPKPAFSKSLSHGGHSIRQAWIAQGSQTTRSQEESSTDNSSSSSTPITSPRRRQSNESNGSETLPPVSLQRSGSDRRKKSLEDRRSQTLSEGQFFNQPMTKHFSFPEGCKSSSNQLSQAQQRGLHVPTSLLCAVHDWENSNPAKHGSREILDLRIPFPFWSRLEENELRDPNNDPTASAISGDNKSTTASVLIPTAIIYRQMFLQTVECLGSPQWELRRMGQQALSVLTDNIRWFDFSILIDMFDQYYVPVSTLMTYGVSLAIRASLLQAIKLHHFAENHEKDGGVHRDLPFAIIGSVQEGVPKWLTVAKQLLERSVMDRLTVISLDILLKGYCNFTTFLNEAEVNNLEVSVVSCLCNVFTHAHPSHRWSMYLVQTGRSQPEMEAVSSGYLSCLKGDNTHHLPQHIQKAVILECHPCLPGFLHLCPISNSIHTLPILLHLLSVFQEESDIEKSILDGCLIVTSFIEKTLLFSGDALSMSFSEALEFSLRGIIDLISLKTMEVSILRQVLEMYVTISQHVSTTDHLVLLFKVLQERLEIIVDLFDDSGRSPEPRLNSGLSYLSNDIPPSPVDTLQLSDDEDDNDSGHCHPLAEALSLNASSGSGQHRLSNSERASMSPRGVGDDDDDQSDSDWDSWEDEEEDQTALQEAFGDFLRKLQGQYRETSMPGELSVFESQLKSAGKQNTKTVRTLLGIE